MTTPPTPAHRGAVNGPAFAVLQEGGLILIGDAQSRVLAVTDAQGALALARMVQGGQADESRPLRSPHYHEVITFVPDPAGGGRLTRVDSEALLQGEGPAQIDAEITLDPPSAAALIRAIEAAVPPGTTVSDRPADDVWSVH